MSDPGEGAPRAPVIPHRPSHCPPQPVEQVVHVYPPSAARHGCDHRRAELEVKLRPLAAEPTALHQGEQLRDCHAVHHPTACRVVGRRSARRVHVRRVALAPLAALDRLRRVGGARRRRRLAARRRLAVGGRRRGLSPCRPKLGKVLELQTTQLVRQLSVVRGASRGGSSRSPPMGLIVLLI